MFLINECYIIALKKKNSFDENFYSYFYFVMTCMTSSSRVYIANPKK